MPYTLENRFYRKEYADGSWASFCMQCLRTVTCDVKDPSLLAEAEAAHCCDPMTLARLQQKQIWL
jgi:hypothetical protein